MSRGRSIAWTNAIWPPRSDARWNAVFARCAPTTASPVPSNYRSISKAAPTYSICAQSGTKSSTTCSTISKPPCLTRMMTRTRGRSVATSPRTELRWSVPPQSTEEIRALAAALKIRMPAAQVLWNRGYRDASCARAFLRAPIEALHDPWLLAGMREAVERLVAAIRAKEPILLYGDYDVDGTSSVVILKKAVEIAGGVASFHVPHRLKDGYGMRSEVVEEAAARGVKLIISVDTGIRAAGVVRHAAALGIDVIVTDHHLPEEDLPPALAVLNPNRPDCGYPDKNLCGAGVAFKLVHALFLRLEWPPERVRRMLESFLKLVAIATVADVTPLTGENRIIVKRGLAGLDRVRNPGLRALLDVAGLNEKG